MNAMLSDVIVLDTSRVLADSYSTMIPGDMGATVIKVERPDGRDDTCRFGPPYRGVKMPTTWDSSKQKRRNARFRDARGKRAPSQTGTRWSVQRRTVCEQFTAGASSSMPRM